MIKGERCVLRPLRMEDAKILADICNDLEVRDYLSNVFPYTDLGEEEFIKSVNSQKNPTDIVFGIEVDENLIGTAGIHRINWTSRNGYFGIAICRKEYWNKGIGTEATNLILKYAFEYINLHKVLLEVYEYNERAIRVYEKVGFKREGRLRKNHYWKGEYYDVIVMGILQEEYFGAADKIRAQG
jgi:RimJ/RimL family protein N-acetyltransferase